jgi:uncharacterized RDD family membrane protein YckC
LIVLKEKGFNMAKSLPEVRYAGFWIRVLAGILDMMIIIAIYGILLAIGLGIVIIFQGLDFKHPVDENVMIGLIIVGVITTNLVYYLYFAILESSSWQATIGMRICRLKITNFAFQRIGFWRAFGRELFTIISGFILYIGYFMIAFTKKKQGLHDIIADTYVIRD